MQVRTVIVHYHIFKNAGSSIDRLLQAAFGERWASLEGATATSLLRPEDLTAFVAERPEIVAISSHLLRPPSPPELNVIPVILLRDPLDRAFSVYSQLRRNTFGELANEEVAKRASFPEFVLWCMENKSSGGMVIANYQVIHLSSASFRAGHIYKAEATEDDFLEAARYLSSGACFGTVDRFDATVSLLRRAAMRAGLNIPGTLAFENVTPCRPRDLHQRVLVAQEQLGSGLCEHYRRENEFDYRLYDWARRAGEPTPWVEADLI